MTNLKQKVFFKTFGCRTNIYDTQVMIEKLKDFDVVDSEEIADIVIVNSCTVTNGADSGVRNYISKQNTLGKKVIIAGCGAFSKGEELFTKKKVFGVLGHSEKENINELLSFKNPFLKMGDLNSVDETIVADYQGKCKAFIKIQEGCNFNCSYCIIPTVRGRARSADEAKILEQVEKLSLNGFGEFVLTGTNIGSYGRDKNTSLGDLLKKISNVRGVRRVRLGSIEPIQIDESFREILKESWLERHLHIALQHTNEEMLRLMRRRNTYKKDLELFNELGELGYALGTDFIVGHPGESMEIWQDAIKNFSKLPITHIHAFCYSVRGGTYSASLHPQINGNVAKERLKELEEIVKENNFNFRKKQNTPLEVLIEEEKNGYFTGYDQFYNRINIKSKNDITKEWISIKEYDVNMEGNYATI
ncbi:MAG: tRNA (N(6)-L-threonylcarbamoyladenosine(37)-C(2))-methylthiotransferase MtaB [Campylobacteraceae bacterium]